ncbi:MAG TPA: hypothetical protein VLF40_02285 [Candidatus Saccharimonadales bacterium]|nr:hypothetical protein [Candidatus Saccharimonadales bacterium]
MSDTPEGLHLNSPETTGTSFVIPGTGEDLPPMTLPGVQHDPRGTRQGGPEVQEDLMRPTTYPHPEYTGRPATEGKPGTKWRDMNPGQKAAFWLSLAGVLGFETVAGVYLIGGGVAAANRIKQQYAATEPAAPTTRPPLTPSTARTTEPPLTQRQIDGVAAEHLAQANGGLNLPSVFPEDSALALSGNIVPVCEANALTNPAATYNALLAGTSFYLSTPNEDDATSMLNALNPTPDLRADYVQLRQQWQAKHPGKMLWIWSSPLDSLQIHGTDNGNGTVTVSAKGSMFYSSFDMPNGVWQAPTADQLRASAPRTLQSVVSLFGAGSKPSLIGSQVNLFANIA